MSKIGNVAMELEEKATELGFESLQQALDAGCEVEYGSDGNSELVEPLVVAHRAWEKEKAIVMGDLMNLMIHQVYDHDIIERAYKFIEAAHD